MKAVASTERRTILRRPNFSESIRKFYIVFTLYFCKTKILNKEAKRVGEDTIFPTVCYKVFRKVAGLSNCFFCFVWRVERGRGFFMLFSVNSGVPHFILGLITGTGTCPALLWGQIDSC